MHKARNLERSEPSLAQITAPMMPIDMDSAMRLSRGHMNFFAFGGVLAPSLRKLQSRKSIEKNRLAFVSEKLNVPLERARVEEFMLCRRHQTDSCAYALNREKGVPISEYSERVYGPVMPRLSREVQKDEELVRMVRKAGPSVIISNMLRIYVNGVSAAVGFNSEDFRGIFTVEGMASNGATKPHMSVYTRILSMVGVSPKEAVYWDDKPPNLVEPSRLGMYTVFVGSNEELNGFKSHANLTVDSTKEGLKILFE